MYAERVRWLDSGCQGDSGWHTVDVFGEALTLDRMTVVTVGIVIHEDEDVLIVAGSWDSTHDAYSNALAIALANIIERERLFEVVP